MAENVIESTLRKALAGDTSVRVNPSDVTDELAGLAGTVNETIARMEEIQDLERLKRRADAFVKFNPQAITVLAPDKSRLDLNKEYERAWRGSYDELMSKKLYDFDIEVTSGEDFYASYETKKRAVTEMCISWPDKSRSYLRLFQTPILDEDGEIDVNYYIYQDMTPEVTLSLYMDKEVERISGNLAALAEGNLDFDLSLGESNEYTAEVHDMMQKINGNLEAVRDAVGMLVSDSQMLVEAATNGELSTRADAGRHKGDFREIIDGINKNLDFIATPINEAMRIIGLYVDNEFTARFASGVVTQGEFEKFRKSIDDLGEKLVFVFGHIRNAVDNISSGSEEVTRGSDEITKAAENVAATSQTCADLSGNVLERMEEIMKQISDLSASNEEVAATSHDVLGHAEEVTRMGADAQKLGNDANRKMSSVEEITTRSVEEIRVLNDQIKEINNIVKIINDITGQINLLALNAAIEAARAGEHGRGFAVVAGEVKNLAAEARSATDHIEKVIGTIGNKSERTAEAILSANTEVISGVESVNSTITALNRIIEGAGQVSSDMREIASAIEDQANIANNVAQSTAEGTNLTKENLREVEDLAALAEETSASTEEIGSAMHEISEMASVMKRNIGRFKID